MSVPKDDPQAVERAETSKRLYTVMEDAAKWFQSCLNSQGGQLSCHTCKSAACLITRSRPFRLAMRHQMLR